MIRANVIDGELLFYDLMLAWVRILQQKYHIVPDLLLGCGINENANPNEFKISVANMNDYFVDGVSAWVDYMNLPFGDEAFEFIVSSHLTENHVMLKSLSEVARVLAAGGIMVVFSFSVCSLLSVQKLLHSNSSFMPAMHSYLNIKNILKSEGLTILEEQSIAYRPISSEDRFSDLLYLETLGRAVFPCLSSCSFVVAKKEYEGLTYELGGSAI